MHATSRVSASLSFVLVAMAGWTAIVNVGRADISQFCLRSTEWLVDNSDIIAVVREPGKGKGDQHTVLRTLKGDADRIVWPLKGSRFDGYEYYEPPSNGVVRIVFVRGSSELLQAVSLGRYHMNAPAIREVLYGVTEYGQLLLTESDLFRTIDARLRSPPAQPVFRKKNSRHYDRSGIEASSDFPLGCADEEYVLIVSFTVARRDHYIKVLESGDAAERIHAISELSQLIDEAARNAIRKASVANDVPVAYQWNSEHAVRVLTGAEVRTRAKQAMVTK